MKKAQTTVEYVVLLAAVILIVTTVYLLTRTSLFTPALNDTANYTDQIKNLTASIMPS